MKLLILALCGAALAAKSLAEEDETPKLWAVLVAGSNSYFNYRHQADVCHAYQILHKHGIPDERIIVMMYDDIANSRENPTKGIIINHPKGKDVYGGVPKDYVKDTVTPDSFLKILRGEVPEGGSGKTLKAGPKDHVFVNFVDHGAPGILAFPGFAPVMVIYVEACESGSMFDGVLPENINIFATTAANGHESSYACYFDDKRSTYLGDWYSVNWMEDSDRENIEKLTLEKQFAITRKETNMSHVQQFGDMKIAQMDVGEFQGLKEAEKIEYESVPIDAVPSTDVPLKIIEKRIAAATSWDQKMALVQQLRQMLENRRTLKMQMFKLAGLAASGPDQAVRFTGKRRTITDIHCHDAVVKHFDRECLALGQNNYATRFVYMLVNMCEEQVPVSTIKESIDAVCQPLKAVNGYFL